MISSNLVEYTATYANCASATETIEFTVDIECTTADDIALTETVPSSTDLEFNFVDDTTVTVSYYFTHAYCDPYVVTFVD